MITIRLAQPADLDFLVETDLLTEGYTVSADEPVMSEEERAAHRAKIAGFLTDPDQAAWVAEDEMNGQRAGTIMARFRDRLHEPPTEANLFLFRYLDAACFPADGRFCEIFQLWVQPAYRRQGLATRLKNTVEAETRRRGLKMIYTHTEATNPHVVEMNLKLGYQEIRRGPIWDEIERVSLVKWL